MPITFFGLGPGSILRDVYWQTSEYLPKLVNLHHVMYIYNIPIIIHSFRVIRHRRSTLPMPLSTVHVENDVQLEPRVPQHCLLPLLLLLPPLLLLPLLPLRPLLPLLLLLEQVVEGVV